MMCAIYTVSPVAGETYRRFVFVAVFFQRDAGNHSSELRQFEDDFDLGADVAG